MIYIIQNRIMRICYNDHDFSEHFKKILLLVYATGSCVRLSRTVNVC